jgi:hypothetical protein
VGLRVGVGGGVRYKGRVVGGRYNGHGQGQGI